MVDPEQLTRKQLLQVVADQQARIEELLAVAALVVTQAEQIQAQTEQIAAQEAKLVEQAARIAELERQLGRNSKNSSQPPSQDAFNRETRRRRGGTGRKPGKQPGQDGTHLARVQDPDVVVDHVPSACCDCDARFDVDVDVDVVGSGGGLGFVARQVHDLPARIEAVVTEHRLHRRRCGCGAVTTASAPAGVQAPVQYGPRVSALVVYLLVVQHVPYQRAVDLIADLCPGLNPSTGWAVNVLERAGRALEPTVAAIEDRLRDRERSPVVHADETGVSVAGERWWLHVVCTDSFTSFHLDPSRGRSAVAAHAVLPACTGVLVHDALNIYDPTTTTSEPTGSGRKRRSRNGEPAPVAVHPDASHALCGAHLLRELTAAAQTHPDQAWIPAAVDALTGLLSVAHAARAAGHHGSGGLAEHAGDLLTSLQRDYRHAVRCGLAAHPAVPGTGAKQSKTRNLLQRMRDRAGDILAFTTDLRIPFTNNQAERDLRPAKTQLKISGCHRSSGTARAWMAIRSVTSTARKQRRRLLQDLHDALIGNPWIPQT